MLIISIPKSSSTSFAWSLSKLIGVNTYQITQLNKKNKVPHEYRFMEHSDIVELDYKTVKMWALSKDIYKQHIPPTDNNVAILKKLFHEHNCKILISLRDPEEIISAYERVKNGGNIKKWNEKKYSRGDTLKSLKLFYNNYIDLYNLFSENINISYYKNIINYTKQEFKNIFNFLNINIEIPKEFILSKKRFTVKNNKIYFLIPARGGSKRLKDKNIIEVFGKPMILWPIDEIKKSKYFNDNIYVSTESKKIKSIVSEYVKVIDRPKILSEDKVWTQDVVNHFLKEINADEKDIVVIVQANSPGVSFDKIDEAISMLIENNLWQVHSVDESLINNGAIHVMRSFVKSHKGKANYNGIIMTDFIDIHYKDDLDNFIKKRSEK